jgi:REP element-mobilizing transposase RayT
VSGATFDETVRMGRSQRSIDIMPGGTYHVMSRGNRKAVIFEDIRMRKRFLEILITEVEAHGIELLVHCEMDTHYHLTVTTPFANLSDFMEQLNGQFARFSNWRYERVGHLFQGPFRHVLIESDLHLFSTLAYVFRNPVKARLANAAERYRWSSYAATAGIAACPGHLCLDWLKFLLPASSLNESQRRLREVIDAANPLAAYVQSIESEIGIEQMTRSGRSYIADRRQKARERLASRPAVERIVTSESKDRAALIYEARVRYGYTTRDIASATGLHPANVSKIFREFLRRHRPNQS